MASRSPQISDLIRCFKITEAQLKEECSDQHMTTLAQSERFLWRVWAKQLGLSEQSVEDIDNDVSLAESGKAQKALNMWHIMNGFMATYGKLVEIFLGGKNARLASDVCKLLKGASNNEGILYHIAGNFARGVNLANWRILIC